MKSLGTEGLPNRREVELTPKRPSTAEYKACLDGLKVLGLGAPELELPGDGSSGIGVIATKRPGPDGRSEMAF